MVGFLVFDQSGRRAEYRLASLIEAAAPGSSRGMARAGVYPAKPGSLSASIEALPPGAHEIWFVYAEDETVDPFLRVGKSLSVVLHAEHKKVKIDMKVPR